MQYIIDKTAEVKEFSNYNGEYVLYSKMETSFGGDALNFICSGDLSYCERIKLSLENKEKW